MTIPNFVSEDWRRIPQNLRYFILSGVLFLGVSWTADQIRLNNNFRDLFFFTGVILISIGVILLLFKQMWLPIKLNFYRHRYPLRDLYRTFCLVRFNDRIILFDSRHKDRKRSYHIHPLETARDLHFNTHALSINDDFDRARLGNATIGQRGDMVYVKVNNYEYRGVIDTRH